MAGSLVALVGAFGTVGALISWDFHSTSLNKEGLKIVVRGGCQGMAVGIVSLATAAVVTDIIYKSINPNNRPHGEQKNKAEYWSLMGAIGTVLLVAVVSSVAAKALLARVGIAITYKEALVNSLLAPVLGLAAVIAVDER